jgi:hypothetical protein
MSADTSIDQKYQSTAQEIIKAGGTPLPVNDTLLKLLGFYIEEDDLDFVISFSASKSQTLAQLIQTSGLSEEQILVKVKALAAREVPIRLLRWPVATWKSEPYLGLRKRQFRIQSQRMKLLFPQAAVAVS